MLAALPDGATACVPVSIGGFVPAHAPLVWVAAGSGIDDECRNQLLESFAVGDSRTMQQDVEFGLVQLTDIAVRALSPGVNDPTTASDVAVHIGDVLLAIWERPTPPARREHDGRIVLTVQPTHAAYLDRSIGPVVRSGATDPEVMSAVVRTLGLVRSAVEGEVAVEASDFEQPDHRVARSAKHESVWRGLDSLSDVDEYPEPARIHERHLGQVDHDVGLGARAGAQAFGEHWSRVSVDLAAHADGTRSVLGDHQSVRCGGHRTNGTSGAKTTTPGRTHHPNG